MNIKFIKMPVILTLSVFILLVSNVIAGDINDNAGTSAFPFLKINVGARAVSMGGAFTGLADDESALYYNPAGIIPYEDESQKRFILGYHNYFVDMQSGFAGYITPFKENFYLSGYISYLNYGDFIGADRFGKETNETFSGGDLLGALSLAYRFNYSFSAAVTTKLIYESIQKYTATGVAFDLGVKYYGDREWFSAGLAVQNLGTQLSAFIKEKDDLPIIVRGGVAVHPRGLPMLISQDIIIPVDNDIEFALGGEYNEFDPLFVRVGWNSFGSNYRANNSDDSIAGLSFGLGFLFNNKQLSYSFSPGADLGESHRITFTGSL